MFNSLPDFDAPPYRLSGVVVGPLLNHAAALAALGGAVHEAPYKAPPQGPILSSEVGTMRIQHLIDGPAVESGSYFETVDPATQDVLAEGAAGGEREVDAAWRRRHRPFRSGPACPPPSAPGSCASLVT
jgi:hypothetical protein